MCYFIVVSDVLRMPWGLFDDALMHVWEKYLNFNALRDKYFSLFRVHKKEDEKSNTYGIVKENSKFTTIFVYSITIYSIWVIIKQIHINKSI